MFEAKGELAVAGVTNKITMPVNILPLADKEKLKVTGSITVKMTDFKVDTAGPEDRARPHQDRRRSQTGLRVDACAEEGRRGAAK